MGLWLVHYMLYLLHLPPQRRTPHTLPLLQRGGPSHGRPSSTNFSNMSPFRGLQSFMNCSSVGAFYGVPSFRNRLLQCESPTGSQALPANLLQHGLLSPQVCRSCQEPAPAQVSHRVTASFGYPPPLVWGPLRAVGGDLLYCGPAWLQGTACPTMVCSAGCRGTFALAPGAPPTPPSTLTVRSAKLFLSHRLTPLFSCSCTVFPS